MGKQRCGEAGEKAAPAASLSFSLQSGTSRTRSHWVCQADSIGETQCATLGTRPPKTPSNLDARLRTFATGDAAVDDSSESLCES